MKMTTTTRQVDGVTVVDVSGQIVFDLLDGRGLPLAWLESSRCKRRSLRR
jgi:hypothetical protein